MKSLILYFFQLVLEIPLNLDLNANYKRGRFFKTLLEKGFKFILSKSKAVAFDLSLVLLLGKIDLVTKEQSRKRNAFRAYGTNRISKVKIPRLAALPK